MSRPILILLLAVISTAANAGGYLGLSYKPLYVWSIPHTPPLISYSGSPSVDTRSLRIYQKAEVLIKAYGISRDKAIRLSAHAIKVSDGYEGFPRSKDILAIAFIESSLNPKAKSRYAEGLMGVNYRVWNPRAPQHVRHDPYLNMEHGVKVLREYYLQLKSKDLAIMAYNMGITSLKRGRTNHRYLRKYYREVGRYK